MYNNIKLKYPTHICCLDAFRFMCPRWYVEDDDGGPFQQNQRKTNKDNNDKVEEDVLLLY